MKIISIVNHKGGVGKSTLSIGLASALAKEYKVLVIDLDPQANTTSILMSEYDEFRSVDQMIVDGENYTAYQGLDQIWCIPSKLSTAKLEAHYAGSAAGYYKVRQVIQQLPQSFDFIIIDCPPSLGWLTQNALNASTHMIVPSTPSKFSADGFDTIMNVYEELKATSNPNIEMLGMILTLVRPITVHNEYKEILREEYGDMILGAQMSNLKDYEEANALFSTITKHAPNGKAGIEVQEITREVKSRLSE
ncbi:ParA family protein [Persicobacter psychrovividus]|uniref:Chromosome partitioning protein ParA n=1 Tax=Persicobacter psychrovividus TaxID=387638 RepID=A0ABM7VN78_9BACT|nr:chromosome partitioning protein ParA [Persicobacter psychrovividus]